MIDIENDGVGCCRLQRLLGSYGSATLMRGKSLTCRLSAHRIWWSLTTSTGRRPKAESGPVGKSETCRASAWPSHRFRTAFVLNDDGYETVLSLEPQSQDRRSVSLTLPCAVPIVLNFALAT